MFTGLVEKAGSVAAVISQPPGALLRIDAGELCADTKIGDSICVNGCCLTVIAIEAEVLEFEAVRETLDRTNLGDLAAGSVVNLERSLAVGDRMGGHFVTGHIDGPATVSRIEPDEKWSKYWFSVAPELTRQMASKGSVTIDGISLTLVDVTDDTFSVALIPHTLAVTTMGRLSVGDTVNIETDVLAKYVQRQLQGDTSNTAWKPADTGKNR